MSKDRHSKAAGTVSVVCRTLQWTEQFFMLNPAATNTSQIRDEDAWALQQLSADGSRAEALKHEPAFASDICVACRQMHLEAIFEDIEVNCGHVQSLSNRDKFDGSCALCSLLKRRIFGTGTRDGDVASQDLKLSATSFEGHVLDNQTFGLFRPLPKVLFFPGESSGDLRSYRDISEEECRGYLGMAKTADLARYFGNSTVADGLRSHFTQRTYRPKLVRSWMEQAGLLGTSTNPVPKIKGMRVIDCEKSVVVDVNENMEYLALSYVWSLANSDMVPLIRKTHDQSDPDKGTRLPQMIPRVVSDAMAVTLDLELRYLWVDQYCIDQYTNKDVLVDHITRMDEVYMHAKLTIVAASTSGALPGVQESARQPQVILNLTVTKDDIASLGTTDLTIFTTNPHIYNTIKKSVWYQRGWCYQESVLSEARLYFTDHETLFQTASMALSDTYPEAHEHLDIMLDGYTESLSVAKLLAPENIEENEWADDMFPLNDPRGRFWAYLSPYLRLLEVYRQKDLSYTYDSINAFKGVLKYFSRANNDFGSVAGIPLFLARPSAHTLILSDGTAEFVEEVFIPPENLDQPHTFDVASAHSGNSRIATSHDSERQNLSAQQIQQFRHESLTAMLLWRHDSHNKHGEIVLKRRLDFPSWSWAGWEGRVSWDTHLWTFSDDYGSPNDDSDKAAEDRETGHHIDDTDKQQPAPSPSDLLSSCTSSPDWSLNSIICRSGESLPLKDWPSSDILPSQHFDDAQYLVGEAFLLPPQKLMLMHSWSKLSELSKLYNVCSKAKNVLWKTYLFAQKLEKRAYESRLATASKFPCLKIERTRGVAERSMVKWPGLLYFRRKLYRLTRMISHSILCKIFKQLHASDASFSVAELANLPMKSPILEGAVRQHLEDGSWGLLVVHARTILVVEWEAKDVAVQDDEKKNAGRVCSRVGCINFAHYLLDDLEAERGLSDILQESPRVQFCME